MKILYIHGKSLEFLTFCFQFFLKKKNINKYCILHEQKGLESGPNGRKVQKLKKAFGENAVECTQMPVKQYLSVRTNRWLRLALVAASGAALTLFAYAYFCAYRAHTAPLVLNLFGAHHVAFVSLAALLAALAKRFVEHAFGALTEHCVEQQRTVVEHVQPDVVVGSSFGGAIAALLLQRGAYSGPTLLLCPAVFKLAAYSGAEPFVAADPAEVAALFAKARG